MQVYESLPRRSVRSGLYEVLAAWKDLALVEFGPEGTMHYHLGEMPVEEGQFYTTGVEEQDLIFGRTTPVEQAVRSIETLCSPRFLVVSSSTVSEIIGTDLEAVCAQLDPMGKTKRIPVDGLPMGKDAAWGRRLAYRLAAEQAVPHLTREADVQPQDVLILGLTPSDWGGRSEINELRRMIRAYFHRELLQDRQGRFALEEMPHAACTWVIRREAVPLAQALEERWGIPWFFRVPCGLNGNEEAVAALERALGQRREEPAFREDWEDAEESLSLLRRRMRPILGQRAAVVADEDLALAYCRYLREDCGLSQVKGVDAYSGGSEEGLLRWEQEEEKRKLLNPQALDLLLADGVTCREVPVPSVCISRPVLAQREISFSRPLLGIRGIGNLAEELDRAWRRAGR